MGVIKDIDWPALRRDQLEPGQMPAAANVQFDDHPSVQTTKSTVQCALHLRFPSVWVSLDLS